MGSIRQNVRELLGSLQPGIRLMAVFKTRTPAEVLEAINAGVHVIGGNYVQETAAILESIGRSVPCHMIGHLQANKVKKAVALFDLVETVDSVALAREIDKRCEALGRTMQVLVEINSGREPNKTGVLPEKTEELVRAVADLPSVRINGLMTMGPFFGEPEESRPYFAETRRVFERLFALNISNVIMSILSMGMSHSYRIALEEGANLIRIGTKIFGERHP